MTRSYFKKYIMHLENHNNAPAYDTMVEALADLKKRGYKTDFNLEENCIICKDVNQSFKPEQFHVVEVHRFEGMTNPDDSSVLYVIETDNDLKGTLLDAYGAYSEAISQEMAQKLKIEY